MSAPKLTEAQRRTMDVLVRHNIEMRAAEWLDADDFADLPGFDLVAFGELVDAGLVEEHPSAQVLFLWRITPAGLSALESLTPRETVEEVERGD